jgi:hypothetical protein
LQSFLWQHGPGKRLPFLRVAHRHRPLIEREIRAGRLTDVLVFSYIAGTEDLNQLDLSIVPTIHTDDDALRGVAQEAVDFRLMLIADIIEARYRKMRSLDREAAQKDLSAALEFLTTLADSPRLDAGQRGYVRHHRGKTLLKLNQPIAARAEFEAVVAARATSLLCMGRIDSLFD